MGSLKEYAEKLHFHTFDYFLGILHQFYTPEELVDLDGKLELSLLLNRDAPLNSRFDLFQLHDAGAITTLFKRYGYDTSTPESSMSIMKGFASEYGFGLDWNKQDSRFKVYFLIFLSLLSNLFIKSPSNNLLPSYISFVPFSMLLISCDNKL